MADARAVDVLVRSLGEDAAGLRWKVAAGLMLIGEAAVDPLIDAAASDQAEVRQHAVHCLGRIGSSRAKPALLSSLDDSDAKVRRYAIRGLKGLAAADDVERLRQVLRTDTWDNAMAAAEVVEAAGEVGRQATLDMALDERNPAAAYSIAARGDPRGLQVLVDLLSEDGTIVDDAVEFLRELGDGRCVPFLAGRLRTATGERGRRIALDLGRIGGPAAVRALVEALSADNRLTRRGAVRALGETHDPALVEPLIRCLAKDKDPKVQALAATALAEIGEPAEGPLRKALEENRKRGKRRSHATRALRQLEARTGAPLRRPRVEPDRLE
jgi:HEAT repeat protein